MSLWLEWGQWLMDGINWYMLIYVFSGFVFYFLFFLFISKSVSRECLRVVPLDATIRYSSISYTLLLYCIWTP